MKFIKLDLTSAYQQVPLDEALQSWLPLTPTNSHQGLYEHTRLPFDVASVPAVFQHIMDTLLQEIPHVICYLDDILVTGSSDAEHLRTLQEVLRRLQQHGVQLSKESVHFSKIPWSVLAPYRQQGYLHLSKEGDRSLRTPPPRNVQKIRSFLGLLNYYAKFLPNPFVTSAPAAPIAMGWTDTVWYGPQPVRRLSTLPHNSQLQHQCLHTTIPRCLSFSWQTHQRMVLEPSFCTRWRMAQSAQWHLCRALLSDNKKKYSQIEKKALALVFGIHKFHKYLCGCHFTLITDHKPLTTILGPKQGNLPMAAARIHCWALFLSAYSYEISFRLTATHSNAGGLSRLLIVESDLPTAFVEATAVNLAQLEALPHCVPLRSGLPHTVTHF